MNTKVDMMLGITIFGKLGVTSTIVLILLVTLEVYPTSIRRVKAECIVTLELMVKLVGFYCNGHPDASKNGIFIYRCMGFAVGLSSGIVGLCVGRFMYIEFFHVSITLFFSQRII